MYKYITTLIILIFFISSCTTESEVAYNKIKNSNDIIQLNDFVINYPNHPERENVYYKLRVLEYKNGLKTEDLVLLKHFINRYKRGRDVEDVRDRYFKISYKNVLKDKDMAAMRVLLKNFPDSKYRKKIEKTIFDWEIDKILQEKDPKIIDQFIKRYPTSKIVPALEEKIIKYRRDKVFKSNDLKKIDQFIYSNPQHVDKDLIDLKNRLLFEQYKVGSIEVIERFLDNNRNFVFKDKLNKILIDKKYQKAISFCEYENLLELDKKFNLDLYKKQVDNFKKNQKKIELWGEWIKQFFKPYKYDEKVQLSMYDIQENSLKDVELILTIPFFIDDISLLLKKVDSKFIIFHLGNILALDLYYQIDIFNKEKIYNNKIKLLNSIKDPKSSIKQLYLYLASNQKDKFFSKLDDVIQNYPNSLWFQFLNYHFNDQYPPNHILKLMYENGKLDYKSVNSEKTIHKNKVDHRGELYIYSKIFHYMLERMRKEGVSLKRSESSEISGIKEYIKDGKLERDPFKKILYFRDDLFKQYKKIEKTGIVTPFLVKKIYQNNPFLTLKKMIFNTSKVNSSIRCLEKDSWCEKKEQLYKIFINNY